MLADEAPENSATILYNLLHQHAIVYKYTLLSSYIYIALAVLLISVSHPPAALGVAYLPLLYLCGPVLSTLHAWTHSDDNNKCSSPGHEYYTCSVGSFYGLLSLSLSVFAISVGWESAPAALKLLFLLNVVVATAWSGLWTYFLCKRFSAKSTGEGSQMSPFLLIRFGCLPSESKKMLVIVPLLVAGSILIFEAYVNR